MPRVKWGIKAADVDDFDRSKQFKNYDGPIPPDGVYAWTIKLLKQQKANREGNPKLWVGLELVPRDGFDEEEYRGYFVMDFIPIMDKTNFRYVPLLDVLGVSGQDFTTRTVTDAEGNITSIGKWRNKKDTVVVAQKIMGKDENGNPRAEIRAGSYGDLRSDIELAEADEELPDDDEYGSDVSDEDYDLEEDDKPRRGRRGSTRVTSRTSSRTKRSSGRGSTRTGKGATTRRRRTRDDDDEVGF